MSLHRSESELRPGSEAGSSTSTVAVWVDAPDAVSALALGEGLNALGKTEIVALERGAWQTVLCSRQDRKQVIVEALETVGCWARTYRLREARVRIESDSPSHV